MLERAVELAKKDLPDTELVRVSGQPHKMVPVYMSACDVLGLTSAYEGSPMVIKEAMACNLPIVSVDVGDVSAVIDGTRHCYLVAPTPEAVAEKLCTVLLDRRRTDGRNKIGHLELGFIADRIIKAYREACRRQVLSD
jgi:glycosyltransferase involved in cell wall biosynthesis